MENHIESLEDTRKLVDSGKLVHPNGVTAEFVCGLVMEKLPRYRESKDPGAAALVRDAPDFCHRRLGVLLAKEALEGQGDPDTRCLAADDRLLEAEAQSAVDPAVIQRRAAWWEQCAQYNRLIAVDEWLDAAARRPEDLRYGCNYADERLTRFERAKQAPPAIEEQRRRWTAQCKSP